MKLMRFTLAGSFLLLVLVPLLTVPQKRLTADEKKPNPFAEKKPPAKKTPDKKTPKKKNPFAEEKKEGGGKTNFANPKTANPKTAAQSFQQIPAKSAADEKVLAQWKKYDRDRLRIRKILEQLEQKFNVASRAKKLKYKQEFEKTLMEWTDDVEPKLIALAAKVLLLDPTDRLAEDVVRQDLPYPKIVEITSAIIAQGDAPNTIVQLSADANFNVNDFQRARDLLEGLEKKGVLDLNRENILSEAKKHVGYWRTEQQIRNRQAKLPQEQRLPHVRMKTSRGVIEFELFEEEAPNTVANFISLVEKKFYDGIHFHRVVPHFVIQAGDPTTKKEYDATKSYGVGGPGYQIKCECYARNARLHFQGSLSMAHSGRDSGGSQFFVTLGTTYDLNAPPKGTKSHTVFGRVVKGMDIVERIRKDDVIEKVTILNKRNHPYIPRKVGDPEPGPQSGPALKKKPAKTKAKTPPTKTANKTTPKKTTPKNPAGKTKSSPVPAPKKSSPKKSSPKKSSPKKSAPKKSSKSAATTTKPKQP